MKDTRTFEELREQFIAKNTLLSDRGFSQVSPFDFYRDMFPVGTLASSKPRSGASSGKPNAIVTRIRTDQMIEELTAAGIKPKGNYSWAMYDNLTELMEVMNDPFGAIPPVSYFGRRRQNNRAHSLHAIGIDIDAVNMQHVKNMLSQFRNGIQPWPTYLVNSGRGIHLYYFLSEPVSLYHNRQPVIGQLRNSLARSFWQDYNTLEFEREAEDQSNICQVFRCPGSQTKLGADYIVTAYKLSENKYTLEDLYVAKGDWMEEVDFRNIFNKEPRKNFYNPRDPKKKKSRKNTTPLEEAKKKWPLWYHNRIELKLPLQKTQDIGKKKCFKCKPALYEWYKREIIKKEVKAGARYWAIMFLCNFGLKCGIAKKQIRSDAFALQPYLDSITEDESNHFTFYDVASALTCMNKGRDTLLIKTTKEIMERKLRLKFPPSKHPHRPKGSRLKMPDHVEAMNSMRAIRYKNTDWRYHGGAPEKQQKVLEWRAKNPDGTKKQCEVETHLSKHTIIKWWGTPPRKYEYGLKLKGYTEAENAVKTQRGEMLTKWEIEEKTQRAEKAKKRAVEKRAEKKREEKAKKNKQQKELF